MRAMANLPTDDDVHKIETLIRSKNPSLEELMRLDLGKL